MIEPHLPDIKIVTSVACLQKLEKEWCELWDRAHEPRFFQRHCWAAEAWEKLFSLKGWQLHILTARIDGFLVAILPLVRKPTLFGHSRFRYLTHAQHLQDVLLDRLLAGTNTAGCVLELMLAACDGTLVLTPVRSDSHLACLFNDKRVKLRQVSNAHVGYLRGREFDAYIRANSKTTLRKENLTYRRLLDFGAVSSYRVTGKDEIVQGLNWLFSRKKHWAWKNRKIPRSWMRDRKALAALEACVLEGCSEGWASLLSICIDGKPSAFALIFNDNGIVTSLVSTQKFLGNGISIGTALLLAQYRLQVFRGAAVIDMLGTTTPEKRALTDTEIEQFELTVTPFT